MTKLFTISGFLWSVLFLVLPYKTIAQEISTTSCKESVNSAKTQIAGYVNFKVDKMNPAYREFPRQRPYIVTFIHNAPYGNPSSLLRQISEKIISRCRDVGVVGFMVTRSDNFTFYGTVNGEVKAFECIDLDKIRKVTPWGFQVCF
jgi:hypothetical protein